MDRGTTKTAFIELKDVSQYASDATMYCCSWRDTRVANFIGTACGLSTTKLFRRKKNGVEVEVEAPNIVKVYTERMGGVDLADQNKCKYSISSTLITRKWWFRIFTGLLDMAITNSWQLYKCSINPEGRLNHQNFILAVADAFLAQARASDLGAPERRLLVPSNHELVLQEKISRCAVCSTNRKRTRTMWMCSECGFAMCAEKCYHFYHTVGKVINSRFHPRTPKESQL